MSTLGSIVRRIVLDIVNWDARLRLLPLFWACDPVMKKQATINLKIASFQVRDHHRHLALVEFLSGATAYETAKKLCISTQTISNWFAGMRANGGQLLTERRRGPAPAQGAKLSPAQQSSLARALWGGLPDQLGLASSLWNSEAIVEFVGVAFGVHICRRTARRYINRLGLGKHYPMGGSRGRFAAAAEWPDREYSSIRSEAKKCGATILWLDECDGAISAMGNKGELFFMFHKGTLDGETIGDFCSRLDREFQCPLFLIAAASSPGFERALAQWQGKNGGEKNPRIFSPTDNLDR